MTIGQIEDKLAKAITSFYSKTIGYGPKEARVYVISDMIIVRLKGQLLLVEKELLKNKEGICLIKNIHEAMHEVLNAKISILIKDITKHQVISSHSDVSTRTEEMIEIFILDKDYETELKNQKITHKSEFKLTA